MSGAKQVPARRVVCSEAADAAGCSHGGTAGCWSPPPDEAERATREWDVKDVERAAGELQIAPAELRSLLAERGFGEDVLARAQRSRVAVYVALVLTGIAVNYLAFGYLLPALVGALWT